MRKFILGLAAALVLSLGVAPTGAKAEALLEVGEHDRVLGAADAPVTIVEYSSLTCPHCASFHKETLPRIKETYIDTGKVKLVYRDFPFDRVGLAAAMVARCQDAKRYYGFVDILFKSQAEWSQASNPLEALKRYAKLAGMTDAKFESCLRDEALQERIIAGRYDAQKAFKLESTPSFMVGDTKVVGAQPFDAFKEAIEAELADAGR